MSDDDLKWFCAECPFDGPEDDVKEHAVQFGHWYAMSECYFMPGFKITTYGVTGCPMPEGTKQTWIDPCQFLSIVRGRLER